MLNGVAPILIFNFPVVPPSVSSILGGIPVVGTSLVEGVGLPIPLYLDEDLTGLYIESETRGLDVTNDAQAKNSGDPASVDQKGLDNIVTINMVSSRGNTLLQILLALCDIAFTQLVSKRYGITYLSGSTVVFGGLLKGFNTNASADETRVHVTMEISKANVVVNTGPNYLTIPAVRGTTPINPLGG